MQYTQETFHLRCQERGINPTSAVALINDLKKRGIGWPEAHATLERKTERQINEINTKYIATPEEIAENFAQAFSGFVMGKNLDDAWLHSATADKGGPSAIVKGSGRTYQNKETGDWVRLPPARYEEYKPLAPAYEDHVVDLEMHREPLKTLSALHPDLAPYTIALKYQTLTGTYITGRDAADLLGIST